MSNNQRKTLLLSVSPIVLTCQEQGQSLLTLLLRCPLSRSSPLAAKLALIMHMNSTLPFVTVSSIDSISITEGVEGKKDAGRSVGKRRDE